MKKILTGVVIAAGLIALLIVFPWNNGIKTDKTNISIKADKASFMEIEKEAVINRLSNENIKLSCMKDTVIEKGSYITFQNVNEKDIHITFKVYEKGRLLFESAKIPGGGETEWRVRLTEGEHEITVRQEPFYIRDITVPLSVYQYGFKLTVQ